jgi:two-component system response regulator DesR
VIGVLLAEDQAMVRGALASLLGLEPDIEVVAEVGRGDEVLDAARRAGPDVALLDIGMPGLDGLEVAELLREQLPDVRVLILTTFNRPGYLRRAMEAARPASCSRTLPPTTWRARSAPRRAVSGSSTPGSRPPRSGRGRTR